MFRKLYSIMARLLPTASSKSVKPSMFAHKDVVMTWGCWLFAEPSRSLSRLSQAGSSATMFQCMNYLASLNLLREEELLKVGFYNPLALVGAELDKIKSDCSVVYNKEKNTFEIER